MTADASGTIGIDFGLGGIAVSDNRRIQRLFKVVSGVNPYAANEVYLNETDGTTAVTGLYQLIATQEQLWEVNGAKTVKPDTVVIGFPNPAGNGFYFSAPAGSLFGDIPELCVIKSGGNVTDIKIRETDPVTGETTCETVAECVSSTCSTVWYCTDTGPEEVAVGDPPPSGWLSGPYETEAEAEVECPYTGGDIDCTICSRTLLAELTATLSGGESAITLNWNGSQWVGNGPLACGSTLYLKFEISSCTQSMYWSCNDLVYTLVSNGSEPTSCTPYVSQSFTISSPAGVNGCGLTCVTRTVTISE